MQLTELTRRDIICEMTTACACNCIRSTCSQLRDLLSKPLIIERLAMIWVLKNMSDIFRLSPDALYRCSGSTLHVYITVHPSRRHTMLSFKCASAMTLHRNEMTWWYRKDTHSYTYESLRTVAQIATHLVHDHINFNTFLSNIVKRTCINIC